MIRFCHNHGLIQVTDRPQWHTVRGGAQHYVDKMLAQHRRRAAAHAGARACVACRRATAPRGDGDHRRRAPNASTRSCWPATATRAWRCWPTPAPTSASVLGAIRYHPNRAVLHTDATVLPKRRLAWAAWNYERAGRRAASEQAAVCLHYLINRLQPLPWQQPVVVSLNPDPGAPADPARVIGELRLQPPGVRPRRHRRAAPAAGAAGPWRTPGSAAPGRATASTKTA